MNWDVLHQEVKDLAAKVGDKPDIIIGIVRGGLIPARLLSSSLGVKEMYCLTVKKVGDERKVLSDITEDLSRKKILLVEDMLETGKSLQVAKEYLEAKGADVKTACLYTMPISEVKPDYSLKEISEVAHFPWE
ncbi:MAG TPA: phosphoribosyltransferase family protein [Candidatus Paceibacterota bacterium]